MCAASPPAEISTPDEEKLLKGVLNTETVAAFVRRVVRYRGDIMKAEYGELKDNSGEIRLLPESIDDLWHLQTW